MVLIAAFAINLIVALLKNWLQDEADDLKAKGDKDSGEQGLLWMIRILTAFTSIVTASINVFLGRIVRRFSSYEKHKTYSKYNLSVAIKLTFSTFCNTAVIPSLAYLSTNRWFTESGLVVDVMYKMFFICFISPLIYLASPVTLIKWCRLKIEKQKGKDSKMTQKTANEYSEGPVLDMAQRYANMMLLTCCTLFFFPLIPVMPLITGLGILY